MDPLRTISTRRALQTEKADARQVLNSAGGYVFELDDLARLRRFLTLGTDGATYYTSAQDLTRDNADVLFRLAGTTHAAAVDVVAEVSEAGRAPRQNPAIFALAVLASTGDADEKRYALAQLPRVARTGTHLFLFARYVEQFRGWGRGLRRAVGEWYLAREVDALAYQAVKYRQREGWSHRDLLRLAHPGTDEAGRRAMFDWIVRGAVGEHTPRLVEGYIKANEATADHPALIRDYGLSWEMLPDDALAKAATWDALLDVGMPQTALMRQLPRLTRLGLLPAMGGRTAEVAARLSDAERLRKARVHPVNVLVAQRTYASGRSARGDGEWTPTTKIVDALDAAFYAAFGAVEPTGKRTMLALDVSGSMAMAPISNMPLTPREASAALSLVTASVEPDQMIVGFTSGRSNSGYYMNRARMDEIGDGLKPLSISPRQRLDDAIRAVSDLEFGQTDCAAPMEYARANGIEVDTFVVYTDNETYHGRIHPHQALVEYRRHTGIDARLVVVGMTATPFSIADPSDPGMLDVAGFDSAVPNLIGDFSRGL
jgi:60 kDa SS-A/Ro ribonucleoprotein